MRPAHRQPPAASMVAAKIAIEGSDYFASDELSEILIGGPSHHLHARSGNKGLSSVYASSAVATCTLRFSSTEQQDTSRP